MRADSCADGMPDPGFSNRFIGKAILLESSRKKIGIGIGIGIAIAVAIGLAQAREADGDTELFSAASTVCIPMN